MRCAHCWEAGASATTFPYRNANRSVGVDYKSACCWADLLDENTNKPLSNEEVAQIIHDNETLSYVPDEE
jgi:hypothetical protein